MATASKVKVQPLADRVVVEPLEETEEMRGGCTESTRVPR